MEINNFSIYGSIISIIISLFVPIILIIVVKRKYNAKATTLLIGVCTFIVFAGILESFVHSYVLGKFPGIQNSILGYALYGALAAAIFEEVGRYITYKRYMKNRMDIGNSLMLGLGHGGIEVLLIIITMASNIVLLNLAKSGMLDSALAGSDEETIAATIEAVIALVQTEPVLFLLAGIERVAALFLQIALSVLVFLSFKNKKYFNIALLFHFLADFVALALVNYVPAVDVELVIVLMSAGACYLTYKFYKKENEATN